MTHANRSKTPRPGDTPRPRAIASARAKTGLSQAAAAAVIYATGGAWENWEQGLRKMHPGLFELFLLKTGQSELGIIRGGTFTPPAMYDARDTQ